MWTNFKKIKYLYIHFNIIFREKINPSMDSLLQGIRVRKNKVNPLKVNFEDPRQRDGRRQETRTPGSGCVEPQGS